MIDTDRWNKIVSDVEMALGKIQIYSVIDWGTDISPLVTFSQSLSSNKQAEFLIEANRFFDNIGIVFIQPVHGGFMGSSPKKKSYGIASIYDSLAPEFNTYPTMIKSLSPYAVLYENLTDGGLINRTIDDVITILKETNCQFVFRAFWVWAPCFDNCSDVPSTITYKYPCDDIGYSYTYLKNAISKIKSEIPSISICCAIPAQRVNRIDYNPLTGKLYTPTQTYAMALDPAKWGIMTPTKQELQKKMQQTIGSDAYYPDITNSNYQKLFLSWAKRLIDCGANAIWIDALFSQAQLFKEYLKTDDHPAIEESFYGASSIIGSIHEYGVPVGTWYRFVELPYAMPNIDFVTASLKSEEIAPPTPCPIMCICMGTPLVDCLGPIRQLRDKVLAKRKAGRRFTSFYYDRLTPILSPILLKMRRE